MSDAPSSDTAPDNPPADGPKSRPVNEAVFAWNGPFGLPEFGRVAPQDFEPAFEVALERDRAEIDAIAADPATPTFQNVVEALELSGRDLARTSSLFWNLVGADSNDVLRDLQTRIAPRLSRHHSQTAADARLFARIDELWQRRGRMNLTTERFRVLEKLWKGFVRSGAALEEPQQEELAAINARLAELGARFSQNLLADERDWHMAVKKKDVLAALPPFLKSAMRAAAQERGLKGHVVTTSRSIYTPFMTFCPDRAMREEVWTAWTSRGGRGGETDNVALVAEIVGLRARRAALLGYASFAEFKLEDQMAKKPANVVELLHRVWEPALARAGEEEAELRAAAAASGANHAIAPHDWAYYAEKVRAERFAFDEAELKPYLSLDAMIEAAFDTATRLFGITFRKMDEAPRYHDDVRVWEVRNADGSHRGVFYGDYFARPSKRSGAWMSAFRGQHRLGDGQSPVIVNVCNFAKARRNQKTLLSFDDARTLFHEFGHALHGLMSNVTHPSVAGTAVARDFVELPSQLYEHWLTVPDVLQRYARHEKSGEPMPDALLEKVLAAQTFNAGFDAVEFTASALVDMAFHAQGAEGTDDPLAFERAQLERLGMPAAITMRHRTPHFAHVFSGDGYSAGYYSYIWAEVLDADAFRAFEDAGDPFDKATARRLRDHIYAVGGSVPPEETYRAFRGAMPSPDAMLEKRGLKQAA